MTDSFDFNDLTLIEIPVSVDGKDFILREADGDTAKKYQNALLGSFTLGPEGKPSKIAGLANVEPMLVSLCLFPVDANGNTSKQHVQESVVGKWPSRVVKKLYEKAKEISEIDKTEDDKTVKNEESDTTDGSD